MNRKTKAKILLGTFIVSGILSQMSAIFPLHAMVTDDDTTTINGARDMTPLHRAAFSDDVYSFVRVLSTIPDRRQISMLNTQTEYTDETVLHIALHYDNIKVAMYIIENFAIDLSKQDAHGDTPLDVAIKKNFTNIADLLRARGAVALLPRRASTLDSHTFDIYLNILHSVYDGDLDRLRYILSTLSNYDQIKLLKVTYLLGYTVLHEAASTNHFEIVKYILDNYNVDIKNAKTYLGKTPLDLAIERGYIDIAQLLRTHGATCSAENSRKYDDFIEKKGHSWSRFWKRLFAHPMDQNDM